MVVLDAQVQENQSSLEELEQCRRNFNQCPDDLEEKAWNYQKDLRSLDEATVNFEHYKEQLRNM